MLPLIGSVIILFLFLFNFYFVERRAHIIRDFNITLSCIIYEGLVKSLKNSLKMELDHEKRDACEHPLINMEGFIF